MSFDAPYLDYHALAPEIVLSGVLVLVLLADLVVDETRKYVVTQLAGIGLLASLIPIVTLAVEGTDRYMFGSAYVVDDFALVLKALFLITGYVVLLLGADYIAEGDYYEGEFSFLLLSSLLGMVVISSARDLISIFVALELLSIPAYMLAGWRKRDLKGNEASLKYYLLGVFASAVMLYGMSLVFGVTKTTVLTGINRALEAGDASAPIVSVGVLFIIVGFAFKISAVPFHFWAPDTYEGAPSPVAAFLSTASKIGGFVGLLVLMFRAFPDVADSWRPVFAVLAVITMSVGNLIALRQQHIIRLLAYSGIAQSGYVLVCFALVDPARPEVTTLAFSAAIVYLVIYGFMDAGAFGAAVAFRERGGGYFISDYAGLWTRSPALALMMAGFMVSLAGAPPMAGVVAKLFVFQATIEANVYWLAVVMGINAVIAAWYYLLVVKKMFLEAPEDETTFDVSPLLRVATGIAAVALVVAFVYPPLITDVAERSAAFFALR